MTSKQQQILAIGVLAALVLVAAAYFFGIKPQLASRSENVAATSAAEDLTTSLGGELAGLEQKRDDLPEAESQVADLTSKFPNDYEQDQWLRMVDGVAADANVVLTAITPTEPSQPVDPSTVPEGTVPTTPPAPTTPVPGTEDTLVAESLITIVATGADSQIADFVAGLETMQRPLLIDTVTFAAADGDSEPIVTITGKTFLARGLTPPEPGDPAAGSGQ